MKKNIYNNDRSVLIAGSGEILPSKSIITDFENIVCADGGYDNIKSISKPILVIGDMDSLKGRIDKGIEVIKLKTDKDETDTELALQWCLREGFTEIYITGIYGSRPDHFYATLLLLMKYKKHNIHLLTDKYDIFLILGGNTYNFSAMKGVSVSFFAFGADAKAIVSKGFKYDFKGVSIKTDNPVGVSNCIVKSNAEISLKKGNLICFVKI